MIGSARLDQPVHWRVLVRKFEQLQRQPQPVGFGAHHIAALFEQQQDAVNLMDRPAEPGRDLGLGQAIRLVGHEFQDVERLLDSRHPVLALRGFVAQSRFVSFASFRCLCRSVRVAGIDRFEGCRELGRRDGPAYGFGSVVRRFTEEIDEAVIGRPQIGRLDGGERVAKEVARRRVDACISPGRARTGLPARFDIGACADSPATTGGWRRPSPHRGSASGH